jgi:anti-sigma regulatory factor (Ser/Thr protein kinase)
MEVSPPYLFSSSYEHESSLAFTTDIDTAVVEMAVHGRWGQRLSMDISVGVRKCLAEHPAAVIADLRDLGDPKGMSVAMWLAGCRAAAALHPPARLAVCVPPQTMLARRLRSVGAERFLPMFATMPEARAAVTSRLPLTDRLQLQLPPEPTSASIARDMVGQACHAWSLPEVLHPARLVMSELVANALEHSGTDMLVTVSQRGAALHLSVGDGSPQLPRLLDPAPVLPGQPLDERGVGLQLVHTVAAAWGSMPTRDGKTVWATVRPGRTGGDDTTEPPRA